MANVRALVYLPWPVRIAVTAPAPHHDPTAHYPRLAFFTLSSGLGKSQVPETILRQLD